MIYLVVFLLFAACSNEQEPTYHNQSSEVPPVVELPPYDDSASDPVVVDNTTLVEKQTFLIFHNLKRCWHDAPRVTWNDTLAHQAKVAALKCDLKAEGTGDSIGYGESLGQVKAQDRWYMEFLRRGPSFVRMVWQDTTELGCAHVVCGTKDVYYCKYAPPADLNNTAGKVKFLKRDFMKCNGTN
jgi:hypothetical protein